MISFQVGRVSFSFISNSFEMHRLSFSSEWIVLFVSNILNESVKCSENILLPLQTVLSKNANLFVINYSYISAIKSALAKLSLQNEMIYFSAIIHFSYFIAQILWWERAIRLQRFRVDEVGMK